MIDRIDDDCTILRAPPRPPAPPQLHTITLDDRELRRIVAALHYWYAHTGIGRNCPGNARDLEAAYFAALDPLTQTETGKLFGALCRVLGMPATPERSATDERH